MSRNNSKALKSGIWYMISNFLVKSVGFLTTPIFTRLLTKADFGAYNNYTSWLSIISVFLTLNLHATLISARYDYEDRFDQYIFSMLGLSSLVSFIGLVIVNVFPAQISAFFQIDIRYMNAMLAYLLFFPAITMFQTKEVYLFEYKKSVFCSLLLAISTALLSVVLVVVMHDKLEARILGSVVPTIVLGIILFVFFGMRGKKIITSFWKYALPISLPYIPHLLSMSLLNSMDRVMITRYCGNEQTALYSLAYSCGAIVTILLTAINNAFAPWLANNLNCKNYKEIRSFSYKYITIFFILVVGIMLLSPEILLILGGKSYMEAIYVLAPVSMGCACQFLYTMYVNVEQFLKKTVGMAIASAVAACVNYVLNYIFIRRIGYLAAAYTTLAGYLCLLAIHIYLVKRLGMSDVFNAKYVIATVIVGVVIMVGITWLYSYSIIRHIVIVAYFVVLTIFLFVNKHNIKRIQMILK